MMCWRCGCFTDLDVREEDPRVPDSRLVIAMLGLVGSEWRFCALLLTGFLTLTRVFSRKKSPACNRGVGDSPPPYSRGPLRPRLWVCPGAPLVF